MGVADDVGGHDAILVVAVEVGVGEGGLEGGVDLIGGDFLVQDGGQLGDGAIRNLDALGVACSLPFTDGTTLPMALAAPVE